MREGAWINAWTGEYCWVDDHAHWLRSHQDEAAKLGLPAEVIAELGEIGWDFTPLAKRIVEGDRITDHWLLAYLGLEAVSQSPQPRAAIQYALDHLLKTFEKKPARQPKGITLSRNLDELSRALDLSQVEQDIVLFVTACHYSRELNRVIQQLRDIRLPEAFNVVACATGRSFIGVSKALAPSAKLVSSGLLQVDGEMALGFEHKIQFLPGLADQLNIPQEDPAQLFYSSFRRATASCLSLDDFQFLGADLEVLLTYLQSAREGHLQGVNVLLHGPVGTGKSQLARVIAQHLGAPLFEIACQDRYGNNLRGDGRLASYQLAQGVVGGDPHLSQKPSQCPARLGGRHDQRDAGRDGGLSEVPGVVECSRAVGITSSR